MKLASIQQICKGAKRIELFSMQSSRVQWISDGGAFYPLYNLPEMKEENVFTLFDIPPKKQEKIHFEHRNGLPGFLSFADTTASESPLEFCNISICARGRILAPIKTSLGITYINEKYLRPFSDAENGIQLYERHTPGGEVYIAVKEGFLLTGIILPYDIITEDFVKELQNIYKLSAVAAENKRLRSDGEEAGQIDLEDILEE
jgi:hypothetical protein